MPRLLQRNVLPPASTQYDQLQQSGGHLLLLCLPLTAAANKEADVDNTTDRCGRDVLPTAQIARIAQTVRPPGSLRDDRTGSAADNVDSAGP